MMCGAAAECRLYFETDAMDLWYRDVMCGWVYSTGGSSAPTGHGQAVFSRVTLAILEDTGARLWQNAVACAVLVNSCLCQQQAWPRCVRRVLLG